MPSRLMNSVTTILPTSVVLSRLAGACTPGRTLGGRRSLRQLAPGPGDESFGWCCAGGYWGLRSECPVVAAQHLVGERVEVGVGEVDDVGGYLDVNADRGAE